VVVEKIMKINKIEKAFNNLGLFPEFMKGDIVVDTTTAFLGSTYAVPFGIALIGLSGLIWPKSEMFFAQSSMENNFPFCLSTVANESPETISEFVGLNGWFNLKR
jgi:L-lactate dehydrogenase (cytochrome)